jgi:hypothetical protein
MGKALTKAQRVDLRGKYDGHCAYCGCELGAVWHADHFEPIIRNAFIAGAGPLHPQNERLDNYMPSCPRCNISKSRMSLESWREWLSGHVESLGKYSTPYKLAKAYGLIAETGHAVVFHFERINAGRAALTEGEP